MQTQTCTDQMGHGSSMALHYVVDGGHAANKDTVIWRLLFNCTKVNSIALLYHENSTKNSESIRLNMQTRKPHLNN